MGRRGAVPLSVLFLALGAAGLASDAEIFRLLAVFALFLAAWAGTHAALGRALPAPWRPCGRDGGSGMRISLIVAVAANGTIGRGNDLPWRLPADLRHFRRATLGKPVIMGRRTFESIGKALPDRLNLVVSGSPGFAPAGVTVAASLPAALDAARAGGAAEAMVIGGARLFAEALPLADRIHLTEIHAEVEGDVFFPPFDRAAWREVARERHAAAPGEVADYSFVTLDRP